MQNMKKANLAEIISDFCSHLSSQQQHKLLTLLTKYEELFDGTLGDFDTDPVSLIGILLWLHI